MPDKLVFCDISTYNLSLEDHSIDFKSKLMDDGQIWI